MKKVSTGLNIVLSCSLIFAAVSTWIGPKILSLLFTPPVSFGMNCEPAAAWSMHKLVWTQIIGLALGALAGIVVMATRKKAAPQETPKA